MNKRIVVYTDPPWAVRETGGLDPELAHIERKILGDEVIIKFGPHEGRSFVHEGPRLMEALRGAAAVAICRVQVSTELVEVIELTCKVVARQGVGTDNLNAALLQRYGIFGFHVPDYCVDEVSTHTIAMLLALERKVCIQNARIKNGYWNVHAGGYPRRTNELSAGIVGFGRIGRATSRKLQAFYRSVIAYDPFVPGDLMAGYGVRKRHNLYDLLAEADAVMLHAPLDVSTRHIINAESIRYMKPDALLINTARGGLVEPEAMLDALINHRIGGYAADVFTPEDPNEHPVNKKIIAFDNVVVSSHRAFLSTQAEESLRVRVAEEIAHVLKTGEPPRFGRLA
jgi:phosphoglycerate dehydrogenase-like enzyme